MKKSLLGLLAVSTIALASCASKCSFEEFQKKVGEIDVKDLTVEKVAVKGTYEHGDEEAEVNFEVSPTDVVAIAKLDATEKAVYSLVTMLNVHFFAGEEMEDTTYYAGSTFKVVMEGEDEKATAKFNKYGLLTSLSGDVEEAEVDIAAKWTIN